MKRIRLSVVPPSEQRLAESLAALPPDTPPAQVLKNLTVDYKGTIQAALRNPLDGAAGITIAEMERSLKILAVVEVAEPLGVLALEDADHEYLCQKVDALRWQYMDERFVAFVHAIKSATEQVEGFDVVAPLPAAPALNGTRKSGTIARR